MSFSQMLHTAASQLRQDNPWEKRAPSAWLGSSPQFHKIVLELALGRCFEQGSSSPSSIFLRRIPPGGVSKTNVKASGNGAPVLSLVD
jgi:hypothetical protein